MFVKVPPFTVKCRVVFPFELPYTAQNLTQASDEASKCFVNKLISQMWLEQGQTAALL